MPRTRARRSHRRSRPPLNPGEPPSPQRARARSEKREAKGTGPRPGSKLAKVIAMLSAKTGATIDAIVKATGWLPHTTRAALTGLRKRGYRIEKESRTDGRTAYRIVGGGSPRKPAAKKKPK